MEKRSFERRDCKFSMRIYSSIKSGAYSVDVSNISFGGAFISSKHLPKQNETISFELVDSSYRPIYMGNARVVRTYGQNGKYGSGFGVKFDSQLNQGLFEQAAQ